MYKRQFLTGLGTAAAAAPTSGFLDRLYARKALKVMDARTLTALPAALTAFDQSGCHSAPERLAISLAVGPCDFAAAEISRALASGPALTPAARLQKNLHPLWLLRVLPNMPASHLAIQFHARGPCHTTFDAAQALRQAIDWMVTDEADSVLCGAADDSSAVLLVLESGNSICHQKVLAELDQNFHLPATPAPGVVSPLAAWVSKLTAVPTT